MSMHQKSAEVSIKLLAFTINLIKIQSNLDKYNEFYEDKKNTYLNSIIEII